MVGSYDFYLLFACTDTFKLPVRINFVYTNKYITSVNGAAVVTHSTTKELKSYDTKLFDIHKHVLF